MPRTALVVPSNRPDQLREFLDAWRPVADWDTFIFVEDAPQKSPDVPADYHYSWHEIHDELGSDDWIISKRDSAIRSFGFYKAWQLGAEFILTLDDDCRPTVTESGWSSDHVKILRDGVPQFAESLPGYRTRGLPYKNRGKIEPMINVGFWHGVPDLDAVQTLANGVTLPRLPTHTRLLPHEQYTPLCGMNLAFHRYATPLMYFPLMGEGQPYRRFDDIWWGIVAKKICDRLGWHIAVGPPHIHHARASDPFVNLIKEAPGIVANEEFWQIIDDTMFSGSTPTGCLFDVADRLKLQSDIYCSRLAKAYRIWAQLFKESPL